MGKADRQGRHSRMMFPVNTGNIMISTQQNRNRSQPIR